MLYAYETAVPYFGDVGSGQLDDTGVCYILLDDRFRETVETDYTYAVFLQASGNGIVYVDQKMPDGFTCRGTPGIKFDWEIKARQKGQTYRLEKPAEPPESRLDYEYIMDRYMRSLMIDYESQWNDELRKIVERTVAEC